MDVLCRRTVARTRRLGKRKTLVSTPVSHLALWRVPGSCEVVISLSERPECYYLRLTSNEVALLCDLLASV